MIPSISWLSDWLYVILITGNLRSDFMVSDVNSSWKWQICTTDMDILFFNSEMWAAVICSDAWWLPRVQSKLIWCICWWKNWDMTVGCEQNALAYSVGKIKFSWICFCEIDSSFDSNNGALQQLCVVMLFVESDDCRKSVSKQERRR